MSPAVPAAAAALFAPVEPSREQARSWALDELSKREYQAAKPGLVAQLWQWLFDQLAKLHLGGNGEWSPGAALGVGLVVLAVVVAAVLGWRRFGGAGARARRSEDVFAATAQLTAAEHRRRAEAAERDEQWALAVRERFRAIARELEERTLLHPAAGRTADEVAAEAGYALPTLAGQLSAGARSFDDVVYGDRAATVALAAGLRELDEAVRAARPRPTATATL